MATLYTWDPKKAAINLRKHGVTFERAVRIFEGFTVQYQDERYDYEEIREIAVGAVEGEEIVVVFTDVSDQERRIISARGAKRSEREAYWHARRRYD